MASDAVRIEQTPNCYGESWKPDVVGCNGGEDPNYLDPQTKTFAHRPCRFVGPCSTIVKEKLQPASTLVRPAEQGRYPYPNSTPQQAPPSFQPRAAVPPTQPPLSRPEVLPPTPQNSTEAALQRRVLEQERELAALRVQQQFRPAPPPQVHVIAQQAPPQSPYPQYNGAQTQTVNYTAPSYLSSPEPYQPGTFGKRLFTETLRAAIKGLSSQVSAFVDHNVFGDKK